MADDGSIFDDPAPAPASTPAPIDSPLIRLSPSAAKSFMSCEFQYLGKYILKIREPKNSNLFFGDVIDATANYNYGHKAISEKDLPKDDLKDFFRSKFDVEKESCTDWAEDSDPAQLKEVGTAAVDVLYQEVMTHVRPEEVQPRLEMEFENSPLKLVGYPDFIERPAAPGQVGVIGDNKTSKRAHPDTFIKQAMQPVVYSVMKDGVSDVKREVRFDVLVRTKKPKVQQLKDVITREYREATLKVIANILAKINLSKQAKNFLPTAYFRGGWECGYCSIADLCRKTWGLPIPESRLKKILTDEETKKEATAGQASVLEKIQVMYQENESIAETTLKTHVNVDALKRRIIV